MAEDPVVPPIPTEEEIGAAARARAEQAAAEAAALEAKMGPLRAVASGAGYQAIIDALRAIQSAGTFEDSPLVDMQVRSAVTVLTSLKNTAQ